MWVEEFVGGATITNAIIESAETQTPPGIWLQTAQGRQRLTNLVDHGDGTWTATFDSVVGDTFVVGWESLAGEQEVVFALTPIPAPWWFKAVLVSVTPPGLWFVYWMIKRRRRAMGMATPIPVT